MKIFRFLEIQTSLLEPKIGKRIKNYFETGLSLWRKVENLRWADWQIKQNSGLQVKFVNFRVNYGNMGRFNVFKLHWIGRFELFWDENWSFKGVATNNCF